MGRRGGSGTETTGQKAGGVDVYSSETPRIDNMIDTPLLTDCFIHKYTRMCAARIAISTQTRHQSPYGTSREIHHMS